MSSTIVINQSNLVADGYNNTYIYRFPNSVQFVDTEIAVSSLTMYFSWANITPIYQNQTFTYSWIVGTTTTTYTITIPSGLFEIADINNYFQYIMIQNGTYLINASQQNVYYAEFLVNPNSYAIQLNTFPVPTSLPSGFTAPVANAATGAVAFPGYPTTTNNMQVGIPASSNFNKIVGFASGFATGASTAGTNLSFLSTITPQVQPNPSIYVGISNISNKYANPSTIIYSVSPNVGFGEKIIEKPPEFTFNRLLSGTYSELRLQFLGIDFSPIQLLDPNISVLLCIREKPKEVGNGK
jgi:hypothetical protein